MSKRGAENYMSRMPNGEVDTGGFGDSEKPMQATAAQLAARKLAKPKGRPRPAGVAPISAPMPASNFSFGASQPQQGASFGFGGQPQPQEQAQQSFGFGGNTNGTSSFNFGGNTQSNGTQGAGSFGASSTGTSSFNFNFGGAQQGQAAAAPFSFGASQPASQPAQPTNSFNFGQSQQQTASTPFSFGASQPNGQASSGGFNFGATTAQNAAAPSPVNGAFNSFGGSQTSKETTPQPSFGFQTAKPAESTNSLFVPQSTAAPSFSFGATAEPAKSDGSKTPTFSFGSTAPSAQPATTEMPKPVFGATPAANPFAGLSKPAQSSTPFSFGATASQITPQPEATPAQTPSSNPFASLSKPAQSSTPFSFGATNTKAPTQTETAPAQTPAKPFGTLFTSASGSNGTTTPSKPSTPAPAPSLFSAPKESATPAQPAPVFAFGAIPASETQDADATPKPNPFGALKRAEPTEKLDLGNSVLKKPAQTPAAAHSSAGFSFDSGSSLFPTGSRIPAATSTFTSQTPAGKSTQPSLFSAPPKAAAFNFGATQPAAPSTTTAPALSFSTDPTPKPSASFGFTPAPSAPSHSTQVPTDVSLPKVSPELLRSVDAAPQKATRPPPTDTDFPADVQSKLDHLKAAQELANERVMKAPAADQELMRLRIFANVQQIRDALIKDYQTGSKRPAPEEDASGREAKKSRTIDGSGFQSAPDGQATRSLSGASKRKPDGPSSSTINDVDKDIAPSPMPTKSLKDLFPSTNPTSATASKLQAMIDKPQTGSTAFPPAFNPISSASTGYVSPFAAKPAAQPAAEKPQSAQISQAFVPPPMAQALPAAAPTAPDPPKFSMPKLLDPKAAMKAFAKTVQKADDTDSEDEDEQAERAAIRKAAARKQVFRNGKFEWADEDEAASGSAAPAEKPKPADVQPVQPTPVKPTSSFLTQSSGATPAANAASFIFGTQRSQTASPASSIGGRSVFDEPRTNLASSQTNIFGHLSNSASAAGTPQHDASDEETDDDADLKGANGSDEASSKGAVASAQDTGRSGASTPSLFDRISKDKPSTTPAKPLFSFGSAAASSASTPSLFASLNKGGGQNGTGAAKPAPTTSLFNFDKTSTTPAAKPAGSLFSFTPIAKPPGDAITTSTTTPGFKFNYAPSRPDTPATQVSASGLETTDAESKDDDEAAAPPDAQTDLMNLDALKEGKQILFEVEEAKAKSTNTKYEVEKATNPDASKWTTEGVGPLLITKDNEKGDVFLTMKIRPSGKFLFHMKVLPIGGFRRLGKTSVASPIIKAGSTNGKLETWAITFDTKEQAEEFEKWGNSVKNGGKA